MQNTEKDSTEPNHILVENGLFNYKIKLTNHACKDFIRGLQKTENYQDPRITDDMEHLFLTKQGTETEPNSRNLIKFDIRQKKKLCDYGRIHAQYGDLYMLGNDLTKDQKKVLMKFNNIKNHVYNENYQLEQTIEVTTQMITNKDQTLFGEFFMKDQGWGNRKGGMKVRLNNKSIMYVKPGDCTHYAFKQGFSFKLEDFDAKVGDEIEFYYWTGAANGHKIELWDLHLFAVPIICKGKEENKEIDFTPLGMNPHQEFLNKTKNVKQYWRGDNYYYGDTYDDDTELFRDFAFFDNNKN